MGRYPTDGQAQMVDNIMYMDGTEGVLEGAC
jgi:hypothetical protein